MRAGKVFNNKVLAGIITEYDDQTYSFCYNAAYLNNDQMPAISLHFPKQIAAFESNILFPFFNNIISEGINKKIQSSILKIDEADAFGFLIKTSAKETIGAIRVEEYDDIKFTNNPKKN
jgi:HipA-like protein